MYVITFRLLIEPLFSYKRLDDPHRGSVGKLYNNPFNMKLIIALLGVLAVIATLTGDTNANPVAGPELQVC